LNEKKKKRLYLIFSILLLIAGTIYLGLMAPTKDGIPGKRVFGIGHFRMGTYHPRVITIFGDVYSTDRFSTPPDTPKLDSLVFFIGNAYPEMGSFWRDGTPTEFTYWHQLNK
jgi:hypothetical protein